MKDSLNFTYDNTLSQDMGVIQASMDSGLFEETFMPTRNIIETKIKGNSKPYFHGFEYDPLEFSLTLYFEENMTSEQVRKVARWLAQPFYKPMIFENRPAYIFYCTYVGDTKKLHNGVEQGVVTLSMRCKDAFIYSPVYMSDLYDLSTNSESGTEVTIPNNGDVELFPEIFIEKIGAGTVSIVNKSNAGETFEFTDLYDGEIIYVDNDNQHIESDFPGIYRYDNFNDGYLELVWGMNYLHIYGNCKVQFRYQYKLLGS